VIQNRQKRLESSAGGITLGRSRLRAESRQYHLTSQNGCKSGKTKGEVGGGPLLNDIDRTKRKAIEDADSVPEGKPDTMFLVIGGLHGRRVYGP